MNEYTEKGKMKRLKDILTDCLLIVPYTVIWIIVLMVAVVVVALQWIIGIYQKIEKRRRDL